MEHTISPLCQIRKAPAIPQMLLAISLAFLTACQGQTKPIHSQKTFSKCRSGIWLQVLGSGGPEFTTGRAASSYIVWEHGKAIFLLDTGNGSFLRFTEAKARWGDLQAVFFSHFHTDHSADLPAFVKASWFGQRQRDLPVFGPWGNHWLPDTSSFLQRLFRTDLGAWSYLGNFLDSPKRDDVNHYRLLPYTIQAHQSPEKAIFDAGGWQVYAHKVTHGPLPAVAYRLQKGPYSIVYSGDTTGQGLTALLQPDTGLFLAHNAIPQAAGQAAKKLHMTPETIGQLATAGKVRRLILSHRMHRSLGEEHNTRKAIEKHWQGTLAFANDLDRFCLGQ